MCQFLEFFYYSHNRRAIISLYSRILRSRTDAVRKFSHVGAEETQLQFKELVPSGTLGGKHLCPDVAHLEGSRGNCGADGVFDQTLRGHARRVTHKDDLNGLH